MTQEEKARAYDEAMERAREFQKSKDGLCVLTAESIFPQLRESESEDERIRKALLEYFGKECDTATYNGIYCYEICAWLEKQKENPKSADSIPSDCTSDAKCEDRWYKVKDSLPNSTREVLCKDAIGNFFIGRYYKSTQSWEVVMYDDCDKSNEDNPPVVEWCEIPSEKQKEQKPWKVGSNAYFTPEQNPKWSEEDEKTFWGLTAYIPDEELERLGVTRLDILKKFKSLRPQPIQLKEAYKEGFQTARHAIALAFMNYLDENRPNGKMGLSNGECEDIDKAFKEGDWAKIIRYVEKYRPSWKPSEEQMKALERASTNEYLSAKQFDILVSLYEQLKKLM